METSILKRVFALVEAPTGLRAKVAASCLRKLCSEDNAAAKGAFIAGQLGELSDEEQGKVVAAIEALV